MSNPKLGKAEWMTLQEFDHETFIEWFISESQAGRMPPERLDEPNWGVSPQFLINASFDAEAAEQAKWMKPLLFLVGVATGMIGGALLSLEAPIYWLTF